MCTRNYTVGDPLSIENSDVDDTAELIRCILQDRRITLNKILTQLSANFRYVKHQLGEFKMINCLDQVDTTFVISST